MPVGGKANLPGAQSAAFFRDIDNPSHFISVGGWKDMASVAAWTKTPEFAAFRKKLDDLCERYQLTNTEFVQSVGNIHLLETRETAAAK